MFEMLKEHPIALTVSILGHLLLLTALIYDYDFDSQSSAGEFARVEPIKASLVDEKLIQAEVDKLKKAQEKKRVQELAATKKHERELLKLKKKRLDEEKRLKKVQRQRALEEKKLKQETARREKIKRERAAELQKQKQAEADKIAAADKKQNQEARIEAELQAQLKLQQEEIDEAERQRVAALEQERDLEEAIIAKAETDRLAALAADADRKEQRRLEGLRDQYLVAIRQKVSRSWIKPDNTGENIVCIVMATQDPAGWVLDVNVLSCEGGGGVLIRSVELAVRKASPLPLPIDPILFDRQLEFVFRPG